ncbi:MAG: hypothetical protein SFU98_19475 [Leptospiraceae bacterium]|nr:hypothetical protein [Leptospiraceae bacterium]
MIRLVFLLSFFLLSHCSGSKGEFGFAVTDDTEKLQLEKHLFIVTEYKMMNTKLIFSPNDTIHYVYRFNFSLFGGYSSKDEFVVALEKESLGFVEIETKKKFIDIDSNTLKDKFSNLEVGKYILKVAHEGDVIDSVEFDIVPDEGYSIKEEETTNDGEKDEIIKYSR